MEVQHRRTYERLGPHEHLEGFEYWKDFNIQNEKIKNMIQSHRRGGWSDMYAF